METLVNFTSQVLEITENIKENTQNLISVMLQTFTLPEIDTAVRNGDVSKFKELQILGYYPTLESIKIAKDKNYVEILSVLEGVED